MVWLLFLIKTKPNRKWSLLPKVVFKKKEELRSLIILIALMRVKYLLYIINER
jgi:hypothetical protein